MITKSSKNFQLSYLVCSVRTPSSLAFPQNRFIWAVSESFDRFSPSFTDTIDINILSNQFLSNQGIFSLQILGTDSKKKLITDPYLWYVLVNGQHHIFSRDMTEATISRLAANRRLLLITIIVPLHQQLLQLSFSAQAEKLRGNGCSELALEVTFADGSTSTVVLNALEIFNKNSMEIFHQILKKSKLRVLNYLK